MKALSDLLSLNTIRTNVNAESWQDAIRSSGELLEQSGSAGASYTQKMIDNVSAHGPYIVIAPGFAFAHSRPDESVKATSMSLVKLTRPVTFGHEKNDPVTLVLALSAIDDNAHRNALAQLAGLLSNREKRAQLDQANTPEELLAVFEESQRAPAQKKADSTAAEASPQDSSQNKNFVLTVCGNGLGTSLFLKNTLEQVLDYWGWGSYLSVEATDTISARGRAKEADFIMTSGEIAKTLGDVGVPVKVIEDFTSHQEIDSALRELYDI